MARMLSIGFTPLTPVPCTPLHHRPHANHRCELELVFINTKVGVTSVALASDPVSEMAYEYHQGLLNWCERETYPMSRLGNPGRWSREKMEGASRELLMGSSSTTSGSGSGGGNGGGSGDSGTSGSASTVFAAYAHQGLSLPNFYRLVESGDTSSVGRAGHVKPGVLRKTHSDGRMYKCPDTCFPPSGKLNANGTHMLGLPWSFVMNSRLGCPFW